MIRIMVYGVSFIVGTVFVALLKCNGVYTSRVFIDLFAIIGGTFLVVEAGYKIARYQDDVLRRFVRMFIGVVLLTFHLHMLLEL